MSAIANAGPTVAEKLFPFVVDDAEHADPRLSADLQSFSWISNDAKQRPEGRRLFLDRSYAGYGHGSVLRYCFI